MHKMIWKENRKFLHEEIVNFESVWPFLLLLNICIVFQIKLHFFIYITTFKFR